MNYLNFQNPTSVVRLSKEEIEIAKKFAEDTHVERHEEYLRRKKYISLEECKENIFRGTLAEFIARNTLVFNGQDISPVNVEIYLPEDKSMDPDLVCLNTVL